MTCIQAVVALSYSIRLVHRSCIRYTMHECLDAILYPMTVNPRFAIWLRSLEAKEGDISNDVLFELRRSNNDKDISFRRMPFTEAQHRSIIKFSTLCETNASTDCILDALTNGIEGWDFIKFARNYRDLGTQLRGSLPLLREKYSDWFEIYRCPVTVCHITIRQINHGSIARSKTKLKQYLRCFSSPNDDRKLNERYDTLDEKACSQFSTGMAPVFTIEVKG